jgi:GntR family transcriptional regulator
MRSLAEIVKEEYFMRPAGGKQNFRIGYLSGQKARRLGVLSTTPILTVQRFLHFSQARNAVYSELFCRTDQFVFSQSLFQKREP